jgi:hypothetical protein
MTTERSHAGVIAATALQLTVLCIVSSWSLKRLNEIGVVTLLVPPKYFFLDLDQIN